MATTPFASRGTGSLIIRDGDVITGDDATGGAGGNLTLEGGDATAATNTDGGDLILRPGVEDGTGALGRVQVTNRTGTEDDAILAVSSAAGNAHTFSWRTGTVQPNTDLVPATAGGDLYVQSDGTMWIASTSGTGNWTQLGAGGGGSTDAGQTGVQYENLTFYIDAGNRTSYGGSGTTWTDLVASATGTLTNVTVTDGYFNFNGTTSIVDFGTLSASNADLFDGGGTALGWVRVESDGGNNAGRIVDTTQSALEGWAFFVDNEGTDVVRLSFLQYFSGGLGVWSTTVTNLPKDEWVHVAVVFDADSSSNTPTLYLNGVSYAVTNLTPTSGTRVSDSGNDLIIGNRSDSARSFDGDINGVFLYSEALTEAEVLRHYNTTNKYLRPDLLGHPSSNNNGESLVIRGGDTSSTGASDSGGDVTLQGGTTASTNVSGTAHGGDINLLGGTSTGGSGIARGGDINLTAGTPGSNNGDGGDVNIAAGAGATGGGNAAGGNLTLTAGDATTSGQGGFISLVGGGSLGGTTTGGPITITGGLSSGPSSIGGVVTITGGQGERRGGPVTIKGGTKNATGANFTSGSILIESGDIGGTSGYDFGSITIQVPDPVTPSTDNVLGADITIKAGTTGIRNADGGDVNITAGDTFGGGGTRFGGTITLTAGDDNNGAATSEGGSVVMVPGTSVSGTDGRVKIQGTGTLEMAERASALGIAAGVGYFWVRNDTPNVPMFTDDAGTDFVLNSGGGGASAWSAVLSTGATTGGTNPILTDGDVFQGADGAAANGGVMAIRGGNVTSGSADGGAVNIDGGDSLGSENNGGEVTITGGGASDGGGGGVTAQGGPGTGTGRSGGNLVLRGGTAGTNATGGQVQISGRIGNGTGGGGLVSIAGGQGGATGAGATVTIDGGDGGGTSGNGGAVRIDGGDVTSGTQGSISIGSVSAGPMLIGINGGGTRIADTLGLGAVGAISLTGDSTITLSPGTDLVLDYATWPSADGTSGQVLSTNGSGTLSWTDASGGGSAWSEETATTTDATAGVTIATPISTVTDGTQQVVEVLITAEAGGSNTYFRRQIFTFYRDGGGAVQWTTEINGTEARRGLAATVTASLSVSGNSVLVTATGQAATNIDWTVQYRTTNTITNGGTVSTTGIVRETFDNRGSALTTGSAAASGGTVDFTIAAGAAYATMGYLRVRTATGTCADATVQFFRDAARTDEVYDAENKDTSTTNGWVDRNPATLMGNDGSGLASNTLYGRITNNDAGSATFNVEAVLWGVT